MKILLLILVFISFSYGEGIDSLLNDYAEESELSKKTKDESAGNLIVYTRDDLERMQVESLKDLLKSLRFFSYAENRLAQPDILNLDPISYYSKGVRIYLNESELLSPIAGSGLILFGDMEMDFIDHVEVYIGFPSFEFGVEPATVVIRLYSKTAEHDEGGRVKATVGTHGTNKQNVYYTNKEEDFSYFIYANRTDDKKETYEHDGETLGRDLQTNRFYASLSTKNHGVELHALKAEGDMFLTSAVGNVPRDTYKRTDFIGLSTNSKFLSDSLTLNMSYTNAINDFSSEYPPGALNGIPVLVFPFEYHSYAQTIKEESFTASLKKEWDLDSQTITVGAKYRYKHFDLTDLVFDINVPAEPQPYKVENVYSIFLEDLIHIDENNLITLSVMNQEYVRKGDVDNQNTTQLRFGYIYTDKSWVSKTFLSSQEFASEPYMTVSPHYGNEELKPEKYTSIIQEFNYTISNTISKVFLAYGTYENMPIIDNTFKIQNAQEDVSSHLAAAELTILFSEKDKLELQANYFYLESPYLSESTVHYNYVIRMLNSINSFDIFNELAIHTGFDNVDDGYNYSVGIKYEVNKDLHLNFKGDNIFNSGLEQSFINQVDPFTGEVTDSVIVPKIERRFLVGMEYLF